MSAIPKNSCDITDFRKSKTNNSEIKIIIFDRYLIEWCYLKSKSIHLLISKSLF